MVPTMRLINSGLGWTFCFDYGHGHIEEMIIGLASYCYSVLDWFPASSFWALPPGQSSLKPPRVLVSQCCMSLFRRNRLIGRREERLGIKTSEKKDGDLWQ